MIIMKMKKIMIKRNIVKKEKKMIMKIMIIMKEQNAKIDF